MEEDVEDDQDVELEERPSQREGADNAPEDSAVGQHGQQEDVLVKGKRVVEGRQGCGAETEESENEEYGLPAPLDQVDDAAIDQEGHREDHNSHTHNDLVEVVAKEEKDENFHSQSEDENEAWHQAGVEFIVAEDERLLGLGLLQGPGQGAFGKFLLQNFPGLGQVSLKKGRVGQQMKREHDDHDEGDNKCFVLSDEVEGQGLVGDELLHQRVQRPNKEESEKGQREQEWVETANFVTDELLQWVRHVEAYIRNPKGQELAIIE